MPSTDNPAGRDLQETDIPDVVDGRYRFVRVLREDRLGRTLEVRDQQADNQSIALKIFWPKFSSDPEFASAVARQVTVARGLVSDHINAVRNSAVSPEGYHYVTTDLGGESLRECLRREDALLPRHTLQVVRQILMALQVGHDRDVVHGDVCPVNVLLESAVPKTRANPFGVGVKVANFGLAELGNAAATSRAEPLYLSPEAAEGKRTDSRSDLFSVGMICCEMLVGKREFHSGLGAAIRGAAVSGDSEKLEKLLADLTPRTRAFVVKALSADPESRFATAHLFRRAVEGSPDYQELIRTPLSVEIAIVVLLIFGIVAAWFGWSQYTKASHQEKLLARRTQELHRLASANAGAGPTETREAYAARCFDTFLTLLEENRRPGGVAMSSALGPEDGAISGTQFLTSLERVAIALNEAREAPDENLRRQLVEYTRKKLAETRSLRQGFAAEAEVWLSYPADGAAARLQRLDRVLVQFHGLLDTLEAELPPAIAKPTPPDTTPPDKTPPDAPPPPPPVPDRDAAWVKILSAGPDLDPTAAFEIAKTEDPETLDPRLLELAEKYRDGLRSRLIKGPQIDQAALAREEQLLTWCRLLGECEACREWPVAREIRLIGDARRFFHDSHTGPFPWSETFTPAPSGGRDWRHDFYLRARMARQMPWLLQDVKARNVYVRQAGDQRTYVRLEVSRPPSESECVFVWIDFDARGVELDRREIRLKRQGLQYQWDDRRIDLARGAVTIEEFTPSLEPGSVPRQAGVRREDLERYAAGQKTLSALARQCLKVTGDGVSIWLSPRVGLVRVAEGNVVQELVYSATQP